MSRDEDEGFLSRWSRRKRVVVEEEAERPQPELDAGPETSEPAPVEDEDEAAALERLGLPDPDTLEKGADFSVFMRAAVPEAIRRRALRRLWKSNPVLAVLDGLNDYDDDYSGGFVKPGMLKTAYKVGRGFLQDSGDRLADADEGATTEPEDTPAPAASSVRAPETSHSLQDEEPDSPPDAGETPESAPTTTAEGDSEPSAPTRRRMAFRFTDNN